MLYYFLLMLMFREQMTVEALVGEELEPPAIIIQVNDESIDAMRCLNMLGKLDEYTTPLSRGRLHPSSS